MTTKMDVLVVFFGYLLATFFERYPHHKEKYRNVPLLVIGCFFCKKARDERKEKGKTLEKGTRKSGIWQWAAQVPTNWRGGAQPWLLNNIPNISLSV